MIEVRMSYEQVTIKNYTDADLTPIIESWLLEREFTVSILANRIEGNKKTGWFSSENVTIFLENFPDGCVIRISGSQETKRYLKQYLSALPQKKKAVSKETIIREREIVSVPCPYCGALVPITEKICQNCKAPVRG